MKIMFVGGPLAAQKKVFEEADWPLFSQKKIEGHIYSRSSKEYAVFIETVEVKQKPRRTPRWCFSSR